MPNQMVTKTCSYVFRRAIRFASEAAIPSRVLVLQPNGVSAVSAELDWKASLIWVAECFRALSVHRCKVRSEATHGK